MSAHSGFLYFFDLLGLDRDSLRVHYKFEANTGPVIVNSAPNFPQLSGFLDPIEDFHANPGTGWFVDNGISIRNGTGLVSDFWSHIFIIEKTDASPGILFDSLMHSSTVASGYILGINGGNKLYFESFDQNGPFTTTSSLMLGKKNLLAVSRANNLLTFYCFDFNNNDVLSESRNINGDYITSSTKGLLGYTLNVPSYAQRGTLKAYVDEYVFLHESITPSTFRYLTSGLCSDYQMAPGDVSSFTGVEITGYRTEVTGVTGVTGYTNQITGSGIDPFGTGGYENYWVTVAQTGYLVSGYQVIAETGSVVRYTTGDSYPVVTLRTGYLKGFSLNEISYIRKITDQDISLLNIYPVFSPKINKEAGYDSVQGQFQLDKNYQESQVEVYLNGIAQLATGYSVTGNFYSSGVSLSGDYRLDGFYLDATGFFSEDDVIIYDEISGGRQRFEVPNIQYNASVPLTATGQFIYLNGVLLLSGLDYYAGASNQFFWKTTQYNGQSGALLVFPSMPFIESSTGTLLNVTGNVPRRNSQLFLNGQRQHINRDYIENSSLDLIKQSGIFETPAFLVYNNEDNFFE